MKSCLKCGSSNLLAMAAGFAIFAVAAGCQSPRTAGFSVDGTLMGDSADPELSVRHVVDDPSLSRIRPARLVTRMSNSGFLQVQTELANETRRDMAVQYKFAWFAEDGMEIQPGKRPWEQIVIHGGESVSLSGVCPELGGVRVKLNVRRMP